MLARVTRSALRAELRARPFAARRALAAGAVRSELNEQPELSAVVLCYRAGGSILKLLDPLAASLRDLGVPYELVLVANTWPDDDDPTPGIVRTYAQGRDNVVVVAKTKGGAMGWDLRSGLEAARGDYVIAIDGDAQNPVGDVARMYRELKTTRADVMKGRRVSRFDGLRRELVSFFYNALFRVMFGTWDIWDINGKPKGLTRPALEQMRLRADDWFIDAEIVLEARRLGLTVAELPVVFRENVERESFVRPGAMLEFLVNMMKRRFRGR